MSSDGYIPYSYSCSIFSKHDGVATMHRAMWRCQDAHSIPYKFDFVVGCRCQFEVLFSHSVYLRATGCLDSAAREHTQSPCVAGNSSSSIQTPVPSISGDDVEHDHQGRWKKKGKCKNRSIFRRMPSNKHKGKYCLTV